MRTSTKTRTPPPATRSMRLPVPRRPSPADRARDAIRSLQDTGFARVPGDGAAFSRIYRILEKRFELERDAFNVGNIDHVHQYTLRRDLFADEWTITRELLPPVTPEVREAYEAKLAGRVAEIVRELREYGVAGFGDTNERSPIDGSWFDTQTLELLAVEAGRAGLSYRVTPCRGFDFAWIDRVD
jgi:hypothetical protein